LTLYEGSVIVPPAEDNCPCSIRALILVREWFERVFANRRSTRSPPSSAVIIWWVLTGSDVSGVVVIATE